MSRPGGIYWSSVGVVLRPQPAVGPALHSHLDHEGRQLFPVHRSIVVHVYLCGRSSYGNGRGAPSRRKSGFFCPKAVLVPPSLFRFEILCEELICVARKEANKDFSKKAFPALVIQFVISSRKYELRAYQLASAWREAFLISLLRKCLFAYVGSCANASWHDQQGVHTEPKVPKPRRSIEQDHKVDEGKSPLADVYTPVRRSRRSLPRC